MLSWVDYRLFASYVDGMATLLFYLLGYYFVKSDKGNRLKEILGYILIFWGFLFMKDAFYMSQLIPNSEFLLDLFLPIDVWATKTCAFYAMELLSPGWVNQKRVILNLSPFVLLTVLFAIFKNTFFYDLVIYYAVIYSLIIFCFIIYNIRDYRRKLRNQYSNLAHIDVQWLGRIIVVMLCCLFFWIYVYYQESYFVDTLYYFCVMLIWCFIAYFTNKQYVPKKEELMESESSMLGVDIPHFVERLERLLTTDYFCTHPQLTLTELAIQLNTNRTSLSNYLNMTLKINFHDFVNLERIKYAELLLLQSNQERLSQEEIAELAGFNSISTFRRAFSKKHNMSPLQYQQQNRA